MSMDFPDFIRALPEPESPVTMNAHIVPSKYALVMFFRVPGDVEVPEHAHGAQWGVVLEGSMEMTIGGETKTYTCGDTYYVPSGVLHRTVIKGGYRGIDVFQDADRYRPRNKEQT